MSLPNAYVETLPPQVTVFEYEAFGLYDVTRVGHKSDRTGVLIRRDTREKSLLEQTRRRGYVSTEREGSCLLCQEESSHQNLNLLAP